MTTETATMTRSDRAARGYLVNVLQMVIYMALQGLLAPVVLRLAGADTLGAYGEMMQVVACFTVFDNAFSTTLSRYMAQQHGVASAPSRFQQIFTTGRTCLLVGSIILAAATALISGPLVSLLRLPNGMAAEAHLSLYLLAGWFIARTPLASYDDALIATQNLTTAHIITGLQNVSRVLGSLTAVLLGFGLVGMISAAIAADLAAGVLYRSYFFRHYPGRRPSWGFPDRDLLGLMFQFAFHAFLIQVAAMLTFNSSQLVAGYVMGAVGISIIYSNQLPAQTAQNLILRLSDNAAPAINELHGKGEADAVQRAFLRVHRLTLNLAIPLATGILLLNRSLISLWVGPQEYGGQLMTWALAALSIVISVEHVNVVYSMALGLEKIVTRFALCEAAASVILACAFGKLWGIGGIPLAVALVIIPKTIYLLHTLSRRVGTTVMQWVREAVMPATFSSAMALLGAWAFARNIGSGTWFTAAACASVFCLIYGAISYATCFSREERFRMRRYLRILVPEQA